MKIQLHIEKLRVEGAGPISSVEMAALIEEQLNELIGYYGAPPGFPESGTLVVGNRTIRVTPGLSRRQMGAEIARRLMRGWHGYAAPANPVPAPAPEPGPEPQGAAEGRTGA